MRSECPSAPKNLICGNEGILVAPTLVLHRKSTNKPRNTQTMTNEIQYIPDSLFPTDNDFEVPSLRLDMAASTCEIPFVCFGEQKRTFKMNGTGTLHFYTDDYRFNAVYEHPEKILQHNPAQIVEPNFSLFNETPIAFGLQAIYKKGARHSCVR